MMLHCYVHIQDHKHVHKNGNSHLLNSTKFTRNPKIINVTVNTQNSFSNYFSYATEHSPSTTFQKHPSFNRYTITLMKILQTHSEWEFLHNYRKLLSTVSSAKGTKWNRYQLLTPKTHEFQNQQNLNKCFTTDTSIKTPTHPWPALHLHVQDTLPLQQCSCCHNINTQ